MFIYIEPHTTVSCPESTDQTPTDQPSAVVALSVVLAIVALLLAVAILAIILLYTSESNLKLLNAVRVCMCVVQHVFRVCVLCVYVCCACVLHARVCVVCV